MADGTEMREFDNIIDDQQTMDKDIPVIHMAYDATIFPNITTEDLRKNNPNYIQLGISPDIIKDMEDEIGIKFDDEMKQYLQDNLIIQKYKKTNKIEYFMKPEKNISSKAFIEELNLPVWNEETKKMEKHIIKAIKISITFI